MNYWNIITNVFIYAHFVNLSSILFIRLNLLHILLFFSLTLSDWSALWYNLWYLGVFIQQCGLWCYVLIYLSCMNMFTEKEENDVHRERSTRIPSHRRQENKIATGKSTHLLLNTKEFLIFFLWHYVVFVILSGCLIPRRKLTWILESIFWYLTKHEKISFQELLQWSFASKARQNGGLHSELKWSEYWTVFLLIFRL